MVSLDTYRTDSAARRALAAFIPRMAEVAANVGMGSWFSIVGSTSNNTTSTIKVP